MGRDKCDEWSGSPAVVKPRLRPAGTDRREFARHASVIHSKGEHVRTGGFAHSNTAENYFSIFKRGVIGTYHHMSEAHLGRYCAEFDLRDNTREMTDGERAEMILKGGEGRRLSYRRTDKLAA